jgi:serine protease
MQIGTPIGDKRTFTMAESTGRHGGARAATVLVLLAFAAAFFTALSVVRPAYAADATIDTVVVKLRDGVIANPAAGLPAGEVSSLRAAMQTTFAQTGYTRDGAVQLQLTSPLSLDAARAAVNRARLLPEVLYANIVAPPFAALGGAAAVTTAASTQAPTLPSIRRIIVKYKDATVLANGRLNLPLPPAQVNQLTSLAGQPVAEQRAMFGGAYVVSLFQALSIDQARSLAAAIASDATIDYAEPDLLIRPALVPNDPLYVGNQWDFMSPPTEMGGVNLPPAWDITTGAAGIVVAVIDTGSLPNHPDLAGRYIGGYDFISDSRIANDGDGRDPDPSDPGDWITAAESASGFFAGCPVSNSSFHGTHVAGTIGAAANNGIGVAGINWVSKILPARALGKCGGYLSDIADAITWSAGLSVPGVPNNPNPARVLNLSLGGYACDSNGQNCTCGSTSQNAINAALGANAVVVVAAGNSNADAVTSTPANCNGVITVAATGRAGQRASYSNYGALVEISAPGGADGQYILSTLNSGTTSPNPNGYDYVFYQGTSMATPHVTGIASLMLSRNPALTPSQVVAKIQTTARAFPTGTNRDCSTSLCGAGIIDAAAAVASAGGATTSTTTLTSAPNPALTGTLVSFTATVAGTQTSAFSIASSGNHTLALIGVGSGSDFTALVDNVQLTSNNTSPTTTTLASAPNPATYGTSVTFTATVTAATGNNPTGSVNFTEAGTSLSDCGAAALSGSSNVKTASCSIASLGGGPHSIVASYSGDAANAASSSSPLSQSITPANQTISFGALPNHTLSDPPFTVSATASSGLAVSFSSLTTAVCTVSGNTVSLLTTGTCTIRASQAGNANYTAAPNVDQSFSVGAGGGGTPFTNGGFETPNLGGSFQYAPSGATWVFSGGAGISGNGTGFTSGNPPAPEGVQVAFIQGAGSQIAQTANIAAGTYTLSLRAAQRGNFNSGTQIVQLQVDGVTVGQYQPPSSAYGSYQTSAFSIASSGNHTLALIGVGSGSDFTALVDNVVLAISIGMQTVATGLTNPVGIEHAGDGSGRLFIVQQGGQIRIVSGGNVLSAPFLDISTLVVSGGEQGLLGLAFHPNYAANGLFYVNYTRAGDGATVIARYQRSASDPNRADAASASILLTVPQPFANHNGGQLRFGPDGYLYIGLGDGGSANDPGNRAQDLSTLLGKMLRIDVNGGTPYAIPPGNPFANDGNPNTLAEIWAYGLRNPWRFSFDRQTGDLYIGDVGQDAYEEIDYQPTGTGAGANYGWRVMEGFHCTGLGGGPPCNDPSLALPIAEYTHDLGCSVTGGFRYRGSGYPALAGYYLYGDYCSGRIWGATRSPSGTWSTVQLSAPGFNISTFGEDQAGELYVASYSDGVIYRFAPS